MSASRIKKNLSPSANLLAGTNGNDVFTTDPAGLEGAVIDGGLGQDTLRLIAGGSFDLRSPAAFNSVERVIGSEHSDMIIINAERFTGLAEIDGGASPALAWDVVELRGASSICGAGRSSISTRSSSARTKLF